MKQSAVLIVLVLGICAPARAADIKIDKEAVVDASQLKRLADVADVQMQPDGGVTGAVVSRSVNPIREVKLAIQYIWLWKNEMHPGNDDPGHTDFYVVPDQIPPGGRVRFTYRPSEPLPRRADGHFEIEVRVVSLVEVQPPAPANP